jgi:hypothetical protein
MDYVEAALDIVQHELAEPRTQELIRQDPLRAHKRYESLSLAEGVNSSKPDFDLKFGARFQPFAAYTGKDSILLRGGTREMKREISIAVELAAAIPPRSGRAALRNGKN